MTIVAQRAKWPWPLSKCLLPNYIPQIRVAELRLKFGERRQSSCPNRKLLGNKVAHFATGPLSAHLGDELPTFRLPVLLAFCLSTRRPLLSLLLSHPGISNFPGQVN